MPTPQPTLPPMMTSWGRIPPNYKSAASTTEMNSWAEMKRGAQSLSVVQDDGGTPVEFKQEQSQETNQQQVTRELLKTFFNRLVLEMPLLDLDRQDLAPSYLTHCSLWLLAPQALDLSLG
ncbi:hypothetical protein CDD83_2722 [Cordyceps sp. RAO-2017]|nr:hypothetical protein CDD83_2722 [Cordyceps sp. RAO-2017]